MENIYRQHFKIKKISNVNSTYKELRFYIFENLIKMKNNKKFIENLENKVLIRELDFFIKKHSINSNPTDISIEELLELDIKFFMLINPYVKKEFLKQYKLEENKEDYCFIFEQYYPIVLDLTFQKEETSVDKISQKQKLDFLIDFYNHNIPILKEENDGVYFFLIELVEKLNSLNIEDRNYFFKNIQKFDILEKKTNKGLSLDIAIKKLNSKKINLETTIMDLKIDYIFLNFYVFSKEEIEQIIDYYTSSTYKIKRIVSKDLLEYIEYHKEEKNYIILKFLTAMETDLNIQEKNIRSINFLSNYINNSQTHPIVNQKTLEIILDIFKRKNLETFGLEDLLINSKKKIKENIDIISDIKKFSDKLKLEDFGKTNIPNVFLDNFSIKYKLPYLKNKKLEQCIESLEQNNFWEIKEINKRNLSIKKIGF